MTAERGTVSDGLADGVDAVGYGSAGRAALAALGTDVATAADARTVLIALELGTATEPAAETARAVADRGATGIVVAAVPTRPDSENGVETDIDHEALSTLRAAADTVLLVPARPDAITGLGRALRAFTRLAREAGLVNLDLADVDTVLSAGDLALFARGRSRVLDDETPPASNSEPAVMSDSTSHAGSTARQARAVVGRALSGLPAGFRVEDAPTVLVHVRCGDGISVGDAGTVVDAVREGVGSNAHVIWGATIHENDGASDDESVPAETLGVEVVVGGVVRTVAGGDPCPRCGATVVEYTLGERSTVACDECGYAGVRTELGV